MNDSDFQKQQQKTKAIFERIDRRYTLMIRVFTVLIIIDCAVVILSVVWLIGGQS